jgi:hypothetical protein
MDASAALLPQRQVADGATTEIMYPDPTDPAVVRVRCRLRPDRGPEEAVVAETPRGRYWFLLHLPVETRLVPSDRVWVTGVDAKGNSYARLLEVVGPSGPTTWQAVRPVQCFELAPDIPSETGF